MGYIGAKGSMDEILAFLTQGQYSFRISVIFVLELPIISLKSQPYTLMPTYSVYGYVEVIFIARFPSDMFIGN